MYNGIKKATGPTIKQTALVKTKSGEVITDSNKQMERWVEHYVELYSTENTITNEALDTIESLPVLTELDTEPTQDDLSKAIDSLTNGKAPGKDAIPPEVITQGKTCTTTSPACSTSPLLEGGNSSSGHARC